MPYCYNCGNLLQDNVKFCSKCGTAVDNDETFQTKCISCGANLKSFELYCPFCGNEIRNAKPLNSVNDLSKQLQAIHQSHNNFSNNLSSFFKSRLSLDSVDKQQSALISSYAIPNSKEDLIEFIILASSNINSKSGTGELSTSEQALSDAWESKLNQAYEKAKISFNNDSDFIKIKRIYEKSIQNKKHNLKRNKFTIVGIIAIPLIILLCLAIYLNFDNQKIEAENQRLEIIVEEVYQCIDNNDYTLARAKATSLIFSGSTTEHGRQETEKWDKTRQELLDIINQAEQACNP